MLAANVVQRGVSGGSAQAIVGGSRNSAATAAGTSQTDATAIKADVNNVSTVGSGAGVILPAASEGSIVVYNSGANALAVYPPSGASINQLSANTAMTLATNTGVVVWYVSSTQLLAILSA